jgi:hypothetical protein
VWQFLAGICISTMNHLPYSPNLAPADFWLFPKLKSALKGKHFLDVEDIRSFVRKKKIGNYGQDFKNCFEQWPKHWEHCEEFKGDSLSLTHSLTHSLSFFLFFTVRRC